MLPVPDQQGLLLSGILPAASGNAWFQWCTVALHGDESRYGCCHIRMLL